jgi:hypothetical protein
MLLKKGNVPALPITCDTGCAYHINQKRSMDNFMKLTPCEKYPHNFLINTINLIIKEHILNGVYLILFPETLHDISY